MKRLKKAGLMPLRNMAFRWNRLRIYYWADAQLSELRTVNVMPTFYYRWLYQVSMKLLDSNRFSRLADWAIHTIPYHVRFDVA
jgi:hypothetical protein